MTPKHIQAWASLASRFHACCPAPAPSSRSRAFHRRGLLPGMASRAHRVLPHLWNWGVLPWAGQPSLFLDSHKSVKIGRPGLAWPLSRTRVTLPCLPTVALSSSWLRTQPFSLRPSKEPEQGRYSVNVSVKIQTPPAFGVLSLFIGAYHTRRHNP